jgi:murein L,D-transpeptidase YcbB/YkuD
VWLGQANARSGRAALSEYERTQRALNRYRTLAAQDDGERLPAEGVPVRPGDTYEGTPRLARLLALTGDLPTDGATDDFGLYTGALIPAVKRFQTRHGLAPNGIIDRATLVELNTPFHVRVRQLEIALERWRRRPYDPNRPAIVLNLPEFRLRAYGGSGAGEAPELEMKVVVGQAPDHKSPILRSQLEEVIFRPYWNVPTRIQRDELVPEIRRDPSWIRANRFEVVTPDGEVAEGGADREELISELSSGEAQLRQKPGPKNTLGLVKFLFPNAYGIYMHDTSARGLFARERRDLSHGCIRVERPEALAEWVLRGQPGWSPARIDSAIHGQETISVKVRRPIQLVTMYVTALVTENGEVHFFRDIYGEDRALEENLTAQGR